jgi:hypothetical protein
MKIKFGAIITDGRNKIGGQVVSKNKAGSYMKNKVTPTNPQTTAQSSKRGNVTSISQAWSGLTDTQRAAWNAAAINYAKSDIFGDLRHPSGFNLFMWLNLNLLNVGESQISTPPASATVSSLTSLAVNTLTAAGVITLDFGPDPVPANHILVVQASGNMSPGRAFSMSYVRLIEIFAAAEASPADIATAWIAKYGSPLAGKKVWFRAFLVNTVNGSASAALNTSGIVA